jgi:signal transduction histidine kinase
VLLTAEKSNGFYSIKVKDKGPGFSSTDRKFLFQKFKKLSARPTAGESSNGLGLAIVKILVDRMGGVIDLQSDSHSGSEFTVKFPAITQVIA